MKKGTAVALSAATALCLAALVALLFFAPQLTHWYVSLRGMQQRFYTVILTAFYVCAAPAAVALFCLLGILQNIRREQAFARINSVRMAIVSWCCMAVAVVTCVAGFTYMPFFLVAAAMVFIFLIVRVVRGCFVAATALKEENSLTI